MACAWRHMLWGTVSRETNPEWVLKSVLEGAGGTRRRELKRDLTAESVSQHHPADFQAGVLCPFRPRWCPIRTLVVWRIHSPVRGFLGPPFLSCSSWCNNMEGGGGPNQCQKQEEEIKGIWIKKGDLKLTVFRDTIAYTENIKTSTENLLELISYFRRFPRYKKCLNSKYFYILGRNN